MDVQLRKGCTRAQWVHAGVTKVLIWGGGGVELDSAQQCIWFPLKVY